MNISSNSSDNAGVCVIIRPLLACTVFGTVDASFISNTGKQAQHVLINFFVILEAGSYKRETVAQIRTCAYDFSAGFSLQILN
jgi:hypothetical protein